MAQIIFLSQIYKERIEKQRELDYYREQIELLYKRVEIVQREIDLTEKIISIIEHEL